MTRSLVSEIYTFVEAYKNEADYNKQKLTDLYYQNFQLNIKYIENESIPSLKNERWFSPIDRTLRRELKSKFNNYWFDTLSYKEMIRAININKNAGSVIHNAKILAEVFVTLSFGKVNCRIPFR